MIRRRVGQIMVMLASSLDWTGLDWVRVVDRSVLRACSIREQGNANGNGRNLRRRVLLVGLGRYSKVLKLGFDKVVRGFVCDVTFYLCLCVCILFYLDFITEDSLISSHRLALVVL